MSGAMQNKRRRGDNCINQKKLHVHFLSILSGNKKYRVILVGRIWNVIIILKTK